MHEHGGQGHGDADYRVGLGIRSKCVPVDMGLTAGVVLEVVPHEGPGVLVVFGLLPGKDVAPDHHDRVVFALAGEHRHVLGHVRAAALVEARLAIELALEQRAASLLVETRCIPDQLHAAYFEVRDLVLQEQLVAQDLGILFLERQRVPPRRTRLPARSGPAERFVHTV